MPSRTSARNAAATRARIVAAAAELMLRDGYAGTSIVRVAQHAEVAVQTVYNAVGSKRALLDAVLDRAASGPQSPRTVVEFMQERTDALADAAAFTRLMADWFVEVHPRILPVLDLIHEAAAGDAEAADIERERASRRLAHYELAARTLRDLPGSAVLDDDAIAATLWSIGHPQVFRQLVQIGGWSHERYREWIVQTLDRVLTAGHDPVAPPL